VVVALLIGSVVLRTKRHAFVIITIAMLLAAQILAVNFRDAPRARTASRSNCRSGARIIQNIPFYYLSCSCWC
jgi:branched-chain amino acid transport system permease protein